MIFGDSRDRYTVTVEPSTVRLRAPSRARPRGGHPRRPSQTPDGHVREVRAGLGLVPATGHQRGRQRGMGPTERALEIVEPDREHPRAPARSQIGSATRSGATPLPATPKQAAAIASISATGCEPRQAQRHVQILADEAHSVDPRDRALPPSTSSRTSRSHSSSATNSRARSSPSRRR